MGVRLVLGSGTLGTTVAEALDDRPGGVTVVTNDENRARTLRESGIDVTEVDPTDPAALGAVSEAPDLVAVLDDDGATNLGAARAAREAFPDAHLVCYTGSETAVASTDLEHLADEVLDPTAIFAGALLERVGTEGVRQRQLLATLRGIDSLAIVTHENPDPDAIASAIALSRLAENAGCTAEVCYFGEITHQENRAFVNLLDFDLRRLEPEDDLDVYDGFALVDHSRPGVNDGLPPDLDIDVVIDHHPPRAPIEADFVDLRSDVGATSTLLVEYLQHFAADIAEDVATGLLFGIRVDTQEFSREVSPADFEAAATLLPHADIGTLERIESPSISGETLSTIARAITNRQREGRILLSCVGRLSDRDALAQAADRLLELEGVDTTVVYGFREGTIYVSARTRGSDIDIGETLRDAFGQIGSAGGHADMAGAQITLGVLEAVEDRDEGLAAIVEGVVSDRFLEALETRADQSIAGIHAHHAGAADEYLVPAEERPAADDADDGGGADGDGAGGEDGEADSNAGGADSNAGGTTSDVDGADGDRSGAGDDGT